MVFREIPFGSPQYKLECALREEILRKPLGLSLYDEDLDAEKDQWHFGLLDSQERLCGCVVAVPMREGQARLRQMAVAADCRGRGLGDRIMAELERALRSRGVTHVCLHARVSAVGFYEKQGYAVTSGEFVEVTIPHVRMDKEIGPRNDDP